MASESSYKPKITKFSLEIYFSTANVKSANIFSSSLTLLKIVRLAPVLLKMMTIELQIVIIMADCFESLKEVKCVERLNNFHPLVESK